MAKQKIVQGSDATIVINLKDTSCSDDTCKPFSLSDFQGATGQFKNADESILSIAGTLLSADIGRIQFDLTEAETDLLEANEDAGFVIYVDNGVSPTGTRIVKNVEGKIGIYERLF